MSDADIENRRIMRDLEGDGFALLPPSSWTSTAKRYSFSQQKSASTTGSVRNLSLTAGSRGSGKSGLPRG